MEMRNVLFALMFGLMLASLSFADCADANYQNTRYLNATITAGTQTYNVTYINSTYVTGFQAVDQNDTKFYASDNVTVLNYSRMRYGASSWAEFWVQVPSITTTSYIIQCFNYSAGATTYNGNISNTFRIFQDNGEYGTSKWISAGNPGFSATTNKAAEGSYSFLMNGTTTQTTAYNITGTLAPNITVGYLVYVPSWMPGYQYIAAPYNTATDLDYSRYYTSDNKIYNLQGGAWTDTGATFTDDRWMWIEQRYNWSAGGSKVTYVQDNVIKNSLNTYQNAAGINKIYLTGGGCQAAGCSMYVDYFYIRDNPQYTPAITIGATMYATPAAPATNTINITSVNVTMTGLGVANEVSFLVGFQNATTTNFNSCWFGATSNTTSVSGYATLNVSNSLNYTGTIACNDSSNWIANYSIDFIFTNNSWAQNNSATMTEASQTQYKSDTLTITTGSAINYSVRHSPVTGYTTISGENFTGTASAGATTFTTSWAGDWLPAPTESAYSENTTGTQTASQNDFNGTYSWTPSTNWKPANMNFTYSLPAAPTLGGTCTAPNWANVCYQETANVSTGCGGLATGNYTYNGTITNVSKLYDGDWGTYAATGSGSNYLMNYSIPNGINNVYWEILGIFVLGRINYTIPSQCIATSILQLKIYGDGFTNYYYCINSSGTSIYLGEQGTGGYVYEEGIYWNTTISGTITNAIPGTAYILNTTAYADCDNNAAPSAWALNTTYTNSSQTINSTETHVSLWTGPLTGVTVTRTAEGSACHTTGAQVLSQVMTINTGAGSVANYSQAGDCIEESSTWSNYALKAGYTNTSQTIQSNSTINNLDTDFSFSVPWSHYTTDHSCWTSGLQQGAGTIVLGASSVYPQSNQTGNCLSFGGFGSYTLQAGYTNTSQTVQANNTMANLDTNFSFVIPWYAAPEGSSCWTGGTQQNSGSITIGAASPVYLKSNQSGDCISESGLWSNYALKAGYTNTSQTIQSNTTIANLDTDFSFNVPWYHISTDNSCWLAGTQQNNGTIVLGAATIYPQSNSTGDCVQEGGPGAYTQTTATEYNQTASANATINTLDSNFTFSIPWYIAPEASACLLTGVQQNSGTIVLSTISVYPKANQTGGCVNMSAFLSYAQNTSSTSTVSTMYINTSRTVQNLADMAWTGLTNTTAGQGSGCLTTHSLSNSYTLPASTTLTQYATESGDCFTEVSAPANITQNTTTQDYIRYGDANVYLFGNVTGTNLLAIAFSGMQWNWTDANTSTAFAGAVANFTFNVGASGTMYQVPYFRVPITTNLTNQTAPAWGVALGYRNSTSYNISDNPYSRTAAVFTAIKYNTALNYSLYRCTNMLLCDVTQSSNWTAVTYTAAAGELRRGDNMSSLGYLMLYDDPISIIWNSQTPSAINTTNIFGLEMNITYNITGDTFSLTNSSIYMDYKTNNTASDCLISTNGTSQCGYQNLSRIEITNLTSPQWNFGLFDNEIYPGTYNIDEKPLEIQIHLNTTIRGNNLMKIQLLNVSNASSYNIFEIMAINLSSASTGTLQVYYCNSTYTAGNLNANANCVQIYTLTARSTYNHSHPGYSSHQVIPMLINTTSGTVNGILVSPTSYFIVKSSQATGDWNISYISNISRADAIQTSANNGVAWSNFVGTVDAHLHQYLGNETFYYYVCANSTATDKTCSSVKSYAISYTTLPPNPGIINYPTYGYYEQNKNITINWTAGSSSANVSHYAVYLLNNDTTINTTITSSTTALNHSYNLTQVGKFYIRVATVDNQTVPLNSTDRSPEISVYSIASTTPTYETNPTSLNATIQQLDEDLGLRMFLNWSSITYSTSGPTSNVFNKSITPDLVAANNTAKSFNWIIEETYSNGTAANISQPTYSQYIIWAYYPESVVIAPSFVMEGDNSTVVMTIFNPIDNATLLAFLDINGTNHTLDRMTATSYDNETLTAPSITTNPTIFNGTGSLNVTFNSTTFQRNASVVTWTVNRLTLSECTFPNASMVLNYTVLDENTGTPLNFTMQAIFLVWSMNNSAVYKSFTYNTANVSATNISTIDFCIDPQNATIGISSTITFTAVGYSPRGVSYTYTGVTNNSQVNQILYALNGTYYNFIVKNVYGNAISGANVLALRNNITAQSVNTNVDGYAQLLMQALFPYNITVSADGYIPSSTIFNPIYGGSTTTVILQFNTTSSRNITTIGYSIDPTTAYRNTTFNITINYTATNTTFSWYSMRVFLYNGTNVSIQNDTTHPTGGVLNYSIVSGAYGVYYVDVRYFENGTSSPIFGMYTYYYVNTSTPDSQLQNLIPAVISGQSYYLILMVIAFIAAGFFLQISIEGAGIAALMVMFIGSWFYPAGVVFFMFGFPITVMELTIITAFAVVAGYLMSK